MSDYRARVLDEKAELDGRVERLSTFVFGPTLSMVQPDEAQRLIQQLVAMRLYSTILGERIAAWSSAS